MIGNYAVLISLDGCSDTSAFQLVDFTGIEELLNIEKKAHYDYRFHWA